MSKPGFLGYGAVGAGAVIGLLMGDWAGLAIASVCLIVGLVVIVASEARGLVLKPVGAKGSSAGRKQARVLVMVREIHACPQRDGKVQENYDPNQTDLELEVFVNCWLLNETEQLPLRIADLQLTLREAGGYSRTGERVSDLKNWGRQIERVSEEESEGSIRTAQVSLADLDTAQPLECGVPREGWLHFRMRDTTPAEFKTGALELSVRDSLSHTYTALASRVRHLPGKIGPIPASSPPEPGGEKVEPPNVSEGRLAAS